MRIQTHLKIHINQFKALTSNNQMILKKIIKI